jgi:phosphoglycolate phosphatase-like HAD superfamily hydrolase
MRNAAREPRTFDLANIRAVLFDLDGTLIESDDRWVEQLAHRLGFLQRIHRGIDPALVARRVVMVTETPANYLLLGMEHLGISTRFFGLADRMRESRGLATRELSATVQGSERLLEALAGRFALAVVTTRGRPEALAFLDQTGLRRFFPVVITRQDVARLKPHPEPVRTAARLLGTEPGTCVMVGDTVNDVLSARRAGAYAVAVLSGFGEQRELEHAGADIVLDFPVDLLALPGWDGLEQKEGTPEPVYPPDTP